MPISAWVLVPGGSAADQTDTLEWLRAEPRAQLGERGLRGVPLVLETTSLPEEAALLAALEASPGVAALLFVHAELSDLDDLARAQTETLSAHRRRRRGGVPAAPASWRPTEHG